MSFKSCYGVDRQGDQVVAVLAQRSGRRVTCTVVPTAPGSTRALSTGTSPAVASIPTARCLTRWIETPFTTPSKARAVLPTLLDVQLPFPLESCHYVCVSLETGPQASRALTAAVRQSDLDAELKSLAIAGLDPVMMDCEPLALWTQAIQELPAIEGSVTRVILYVGDDSFRMAVGRGSNYLGGHSTRPDDIAQLIRFAKLYDTAGSSAREWWLCGPGAARPDRAASLRTALTDAGDGTISIIREPAHFLARAVATRALLDGPLRCNLRIDASLHPSLRRGEQRQAIRAACLTLMAGLTLIAVNVGSSWFLQHSSARMDQNFRTLAESLTGSPLAGKKGEQALQFVKNSLKQRESEMAPFLIRSRPMPSDTLTSILQAASTHRIQIEHLDIHTDTLSLEGSCISMSDSNALAESIRQLGFTVSIRELSTLPDGRLGFSIVPAIPSI